MRTADNDDERLDRAGRDGRIAFTAAAFGLGCALLVLLDRVGLPENLSIGAALLLVVAILCGIGLVLRSVRISTFYAASRSVPATYAGLSGAASLAALALIFLPPVPNGLTLAAAAGGLAAGVLALALFSAPLLRKSGAFSLSDLLTRRFPGIGFRLLAVLAVVTICALTSLAGLEQAASILAGGAEEARAAACLAVGLILCVLIAPGGLAGQVWTAAAAAAMLIAAQILPLGALTLQGVALPTPLFGAADIWEHGSTRILEWTGLDASLEGVWLAAPIALGLAGFAPLLSLAAAARTRAGAQRTQLAVAFWIVVLLAAMILTMASSALALDLGLLGQRPDRLADLFYRASAEGWLTICGKSVDGPAAARAACAALPDFAALLRPEDYSATPGFLLFGLADLRELGGALRGVALAGWVAVCLGLAAAGLQGLATALGHDLAYRARERFVITSRRLATTRLLLVGAAFACAALLSGRSLDPRLLIGAALALSAVTTLPAMLLALWPRAGSLDAALAMVVGAGTAAAVIYQVTSMGLAIEVQDIGFAAIAGAAAAIATGLAVSLRPGAAQRQGALFIDSLLSGDRLNPERGA